MRAPFIIAAIAAACMAAPVAAQQDAEPATEAEPGAQAEAPAEAAAPPAFNGTATGSVSGRRLDVPVVCTGFEEQGGVTVQSDPGDDPTQDSNGDGVVVDLAAQPTGVISVHLLAGNQLFALQDTSAQLGPKSLTYSITMSFVGGGEDKVEVSVTCD